MLEAREVVLTLGERRVLDRVSVSVAPGELVVLVGPNGAGKSSLLRVLSREWTPNEGEVLLEGRPLASYAPRELARRRAVLPQSSAADLALPAREVVLLGRSPHLRGEESAEDIAAAEGALAALSAAHLAERMYDALSGGERQRVQLARVLAQVWSGSEARYLVLDEPTTSLDLKHQHGVLALVLARVRAGMGAVVVLHDLGLAAQYATKLVLLADGRVLATGSAAEVLSEERLRDGFGVRGALQSVGGVPVVAVRGEEP